MAIDFLSYYKGVELAKATERNDIAWQQKLEQAEMDREESKANRAAAMYLAPVYGLKAAAIKDGATEADFAINLQDIVMNSDTFKALHPLAQAKVQRDINDTLINTANNYRLSKDYATADMIFNKTGFQSRAQPEITAAKDYQSAINILTASGKLTRDGEGQLALAGVPVTEEQLSALMPVLLTNPQVNPLATALSVQQAAAQAKADRYAVERKDELGIAAQRASMVMQLAPYRPDLSIEELGQAIDHFLKLPPSTESEVASPSAASEAASPSTESEAASPFAAVSSSTQSTAPIPKPLSWMEQVIATQKAAQIKRGARTRIQEMQAKAPIPLSTDGLGPLDQLAMETLSSAGTLEEMEREQLIKKHQAQITKPLPPVVLPLRFNAKDVAELGVMLQNPQTVNHIRQNPTLLAALKTRLVEFKIANPASGVEIAKLFKAL